MQHCLILESVAGSHLLGISFLEDLLQFSTFAADVNTEDLVDTQVAT